MYDPEFNLKIQSLQEELQAAIQSLREEFIAIDKNHLMLEFCDLFDQAIEILMQKYEDWSNCFDADEKKVIGREINSIINAMQTTIANVKNVFNEN